MQFKMGKCALLSCTLCLEIWLNGLKMWNWAKINLNYFDCINDDTLPKSTCIYIDWRGRHTHTHRNAKNEVNEKEKTPENIMDKVTTTKTREKNRTEKKAKE